MKGTSFVQITDFNKISNLVRGVDSTDDVNGSISKKRETSSAPIPHVDNDDGPVIEDAENLSSTKNAYDKQTSDTCKDTNARNENEDEDPMAILYE